MIVSHCKSVWQACPNSVYRPLHLRTKQMSRCNTWQDLRLCQYQPYNPGLVNRHLQAISIWRVLVSEIVRTVKTTTVACRKDNARALWVSIGPVSGYSIGNDATRECKTTMVMVLGFRHGLVVWDTRCRQLWGHSWAFISAVNPFRV